MAVGTRQPQWSVRRLFSNNLAFLVQLTRKYTNWVLTYDLIDRPLLVCYTKDLHAEVCYFWCENSLLWLWQLWSIMKLQVGSKSTMPMRGIYDTGVWSEWVRYLFRNLKQKEILPWVESRSNCRACACIEKSQCFWYLRNIHVPVTVAALSGHPLLSGQFSRCRFFAHTNAGTPELI